MDHIVRTHLSILEYSIEFDLKLKRKNHSTPKNFLDYINTYSVSLTGRRKQIDASVERLEKGLVKLKDGAD